MKRVMIVGGPGSGKSTLARIMGEGTGLPVHHMDHLHWLPDWQERPRADKLALAHNIETSEAWIFEGGLSATYGHRAGRADTLIWLDLPVLLRLWRVTSRMIRHYGRRRPDMAEGCVEKLHGETFEFYHYIWRTRRTHRHRLQELIDRHPRLAVHHLRSPAEVTAFIRHLPSRAEHRPATQSILP
ncbi:P-loop NTPase family protein [Roseobacter sinensis]|uniref:AAA family ATPase n=1 Tax=Roseobacter sinensis TaxID=2931391 RepID=A0ABT3BHY4_9RHOB|nr:AAA family ATPase [Roseobacter sp. WL0113]MCV3272994.1 AAA family ATPase [Roseobacter sp. WL0113]